MHYKVIKNCLIAVTGVMLLTGCGNTDNDENNNTLINAYSEVESEYTTIQVPTIQREDIEN